MKLLPALALLVLSLSFCNLFGNRNTANSNTTNANAANTSTANSNNRTTTTGSSVAMSDDDKHKLFQAAGMTRDSATVMEVSKKIGILGDNNTPTDYYQTFVNSHMDWARKNIAFMREISTPEKAKDYIDKHK